MTVRSSKTKPYLQKTETCDVAPHPSPETFELLKELYADGGSIFCAYHTLGITYHDTKFLTVVDGELYVDRERELQSLFPSHSYFFDDTLTPRPVRFRGFWTSLRNTRRLAKLHGDVQQLTRECDARLRHPLNSNSLVDAKRTFFNDYEFIFTVNLFAQRAVDLLRSSLPPSMTLAQALRYFPSDLPQTLEPPAHLVGNTLELADTSPFVALFPNSGDQVVPNDIPLVVLRNAQLFMRLREYGRWLALRHICELRRFISHPLGSEAIVQPVLASRPSFGNQIKSVGVSAGKAMGLIVTTPEQGGILAVSALTPELAAHASMLRGVIADHGSILSHFAIIAREIGLPVIVHYPVNQLKPGQQVSIDGSAGTVELL